jgi:hypothetical protein
MRFGCVGATLRRRCAAAQRSAAERQADSPPPPPAESNRRSPHRIVGVPPACTGESRGAPGYSPMVSFVLHAAGRAARRPVEGTRAAARAPLCAPTLRQRRIDRRRPAMRLGAPRARCAPTHAAVPRPPHALRRRRAAHARTAARLPPPATAARAAAHRRRRRRPARADQLQCSAVQRGAEQCGPFRRSTVVRHASGNGSGAHAVTVRTPSRTSG